MFRNQLIAGLGFANIFAGVNAIDVDLDLREFAPNLHCRVDIGKGKTFQSDNGHLLQTLKDRAFQLARESEMSIPKCSSGLSSCTMFNGKEVCKKAMAQWLGNIYKKLSENEKHQALFLKIFECGAPGRTVHKVDVSEQIVDKPVASLNEEQCKKALDNQDQQWKQREQELIMSLNEQWKQRDQQWKQRDQEWEQRDQQWKQRDQQLLNKFGELQKKMLELINKDQQIGQDLKRLYLKAMGAAIDH